MPQTITLHDIVTHLETMLDDAAAEGAPETADLISKVLFCVSMAATDREIIAKARLTGRIAQAMKYERSAESNFAEARTRMVLFGTHVVVGGETAEDVTR